MWQGTSAQQRNAAPPGHARGDERSRGGGGYDRPPQAHPPRSQPQGNAWDWRDLFHGGSQAPDQEPANGFSLGNLFGGGPSGSSFNLFGSQQPEEPLSIESLLHLPGNEECADCGALGPEWASANQGTVICIDCAGVHRSLGAHISKVKSTRLDAWKTEEMRAFRAQGGNTAVNKRLAKRAGRLAPSTRNYSNARPDGSSGKPDINEYIRRKYHATGPADSNGYADERHRNAPHPGAGPVPVAPTTVAGAAAGRTCFQGVCFVEIMNIEISDERARDLRMLGAMFLSLSVTMGLGTMTAEPSSAKRGSSVASWQPPERREILWDCEERWLWCRVYDGAELMGLGQLAAEGRIDLRLLHGQGEASNVEVCLDLFASGGDDSDDDGRGPHRARRGHSFGAPPGYFSEAGGYRGFEDPSDPAAYGQCCGVARLRLTLVDMSSMDSGKKPAGRGSHGQGYGQGQGYQQRESSAWDFWPNGLQSGISDLIGLAPQAGRGQPDRAGRSRT